MKSLISSSPKADAELYDESYEEDIEDERPKNKSNDTANPSIKIGDMILSRDQYEYLYTNASFKRHGLRRSINHWPNAVVPIKINDEFDSDYIQLLKSAMDYISSVSCIKFDLEAKNPPDFVLITKGEGCSSQVGNLRQGAQTMKLHENCQKGNVIHEMLHTLGFLHMHTAVSRDDYVRVNYSNIKRSAMKNFEKYTVYVSMFGTMYDYRSIMHYSRKAFAIDKSRPTIIPGERVSSMGQRESNRRQNYNGFNSLRVLLSFKI